MKLSTRLIASALLAGIVLAVGGCAKTLPPEGERLLLEGYSAYDSRNDRQTVGLMDRFLQQYREYPRTDEALYLRGQAGLRSGASDQAESDLLQAIRLSDMPELKGKAYNALGDISYDAGNMPAAQNRYEAALANLPRGAGPAAHAHYRLATVYQRQSQWDKADLQLSRLRHLFPDSRLAELAKRRSRARAWSIQTGAYRDRQLAQGNAAQLRSDGLDSFVRVTLADGKPLYTVLVGRYATYAQAEAALARVREHRPDAFLTVTR